MAYQVIARKWRPQTFDEVTGQEPITRTLRGAIEHERLHHAYLFSGARGVGKTTTARLLAKALNCHRAERPTPTPCPTSDERACASCREIAEGRSIDVLEIDAASNTGVDNVRESIINTIAVRPARDRYKVFIIDEVHMLSGAAFNALLKTLEEPPSRVVFIMATTELHKVPETILSRCQQFEFRTIPLSKIAERLRLIAGAEKISVSEEALREIARAGEGSMRDAQSAFDQVISFSDDSITLEDVETALGIASAELRARVMRSVADGRPAETLAVVDELAMRGHDLRNFCRDLLAHLRDLLVVKVAGEGAELTDATESERRDLAREADAFSESDLVRFFHSLTETEKALRESAHPRYQLEVGLVKLIEMRRLAPLGQILERLSALEQSLRADAKGGITPAGTTGAAPPPPGASGGSSPPARRGRIGGGKTATASDASAPPEYGAEKRDNDITSTRPAETPRVPDFAVEPPLGPSGDARGRGLQTTPALKLVPPAAEETFDAPAMRPPSFDAPPLEDDRGGSSVPASVSGAAPGDRLERIKAALDDRRKPFLVVALEGARAVRLENEELYVEYAPEGRHLRDNLAKPENVRVLRDACREVVGHDLGVRIVVKEAGDGEGGAPLSEQDEALREKQRLREMAEQHPAVQQLLRTFRGEIVDVRRIEEQ